MSVGVILLTLVYVLDFTRPESEMQLGVTFSSVQAQRFGLDWQEAFLAVLDELNVKNLRLIAYWDEIEKEEGVYDFSNIRFQLEEAKKRNVDVILAIGYRVPRWPECFAPGWTARLSNSEFQTRLLKYIEELVLTLRDEKHISHWQLENEPYLEVFGLCPKPDPAFFEKEMELIKKLDSRPVIVTDSGELSAWGHAGEHGDVFGTSMYIKVWNRYVGFFEWVLPAAYYPLKFKIFVGEKPFYLMELQSEPWGSQDRFLGDIPIAEQLKIFNERHLKAYVSYAKKSGFSRIYLWGVEWWYWLKVNGYENVWNASSDIFQNKQY